MDGMGLCSLRASGTDGTQVLYHSKPSITLNIGNNTTGTTQVPDGSCGIFSGCINNSSTSQVTITAASGENNNNTFSGNTISNCYTGILMRGYGISTGPSSFPDLNNTVGGASASLGNTITNYGGSGVSNQAYAVRSLNQDNLLVQYNQSTILLSTISLSMEFPFQDQTAQQNFKLHQGILNNSITLKQGSNANDARLFM